MEGKKPNTFVHVYGRRDDSKARGANGSANVASLTRLAPTGMAFVEFIVILIFNVESLVENI